MAALIPSRKERALARRDTTDSLLEFQSPTAALIALPVPSSARVVSLLITAAVATSILLAATIPIDRVVTASGKLVPKSATLVVQPLETSIIRSIEVHEGQSVKAGQLLARLDPTFASADAGSLATQVRSLQAEVDRLQAEAAALESSHADTEPTMRQTPQTRRSNYRSRFTASAMLSRFSN